MHRVQLISILLLPLLAAGCLGRSPHQATPVTTVRTETTAISRMHLTVFTMTDGVLVAKDVAVPQTEATASASLRALGLPASVTIADGTATVDLPDATPEQVAEIVYTLTQYASIQRVDVAGQTGLTRADVDRYVAPITIFSPAAGATVAKTFHVTGTAMVFEATFVLQLRIASKIAVKETVTASAGAPSRGTFDVAMTSPATGPAEIVAYEPSAENGQPLHTVTVPIVIAR